ncbi:hypothetical protein ALC62_14148 [Cyphomyrmex costatus]|uniref:Uncharacterized protein n=1 Tax=Cyphomyrmex costatus TaxID=456900 RepID=A0A195C321_9HYME|nr:hypothetical protein ALC62_14148 [Cyphomyrmex costatus]
MYVKKTCFRIIIAPKLDVAGHNVEHVNGDTIYNMQILMANSKGRGSSNRTIKKASGVSRDDVTRARNYLILAMVLTLLSKCTMWSCTPEVIRRKVDGMAT